MSKRMDYLDGMWVFIGFVFGVGLFGFLSELQRKVFPSQLVSGGWWFGCFVVVCGVGLSIFFGLVWFSIWVSL